MTPDGKQIPILGQELVVSAVESTEGNTVKLISVPYKPPANSIAPTTEDKVEKEPPAIPLDLSSIQDLESDFNNVPFQWKRLQFRVATANNGRRPELQQHFVVYVKVVATLATGAKVSLCQIVSNSIIVRGRSPRNFQARKDTPLNGAGHARKSGNAHPQMTRTSTGESTRKQQDTGPTSAPIKNEVDHPAMSVQSSFPDHNDLPHIPTDMMFDDFLRNFHQQGAMTALPTDPLPMANAAYANSSPDIVRQRRPPPVAIAPIDLSLDEEEPIKRRAYPLPEYRIDAVGTSKKVSMPPRPPSFSINPANSPSDESADLLYEYFPLGLDDWMPPVDAVYRPHVVHHINTSVDPRDPKSAPRGRSKRYFSEDMG